MGVLQGHVTVSWSPRNLGLDADVASPSPHQCPSNCGPTWAIVGEVATFKGHPSANGQLYHNSLSCRWLGVVMSASEPE